MAYLKKESFMNVVQTFQLYQNEMEEITQWKLTHNLVCPIGSLSESQFGAIRQNKYRIAFRHTTINTALYVICDCGKEFRSQKRDEKA